MATLPHQFEDTRGRVWTLEIHPVSIRRVREGCGVAIGALLDDNFSGLSALFADPEKLADVLYLLAKEEADARGVTDVDFGKALGAGVLEQAADAFVRAFADFSRSQVRGPLLALAKKAAEYGERATARLGAAIESFDVGKLLTSNDSAGGSQASAESTPPG
jgi:hypothetical protein